MEVYEVLCEGVNEPRVFRFDSFNEASAEAERLCQRHNVEVRIVRVIGCYKPVARWISNDGVGMKGEK